MIAACVVRITAICCGSFTVNEEYLMAKLPHIGVFVRLKPSRLHGIGVFAIRDIPRGTYVFQPDSEELLWVKASAANHLPKYI
jgi:hypothetical protein